MTYTESPPLDEEQTGAEQSHTAENKHPESFYESYASSFPQAKGLLSSPEGMGVMTLGVIIPTLLMSAASVTCADRITRMMLKQPLETTVELGLAVLIPFANLHIWRALSKDDRRSAKRRGILNGMAIGTAGIIAAIAWTAVGLNYPSVDEINGNPNPGAFTSIAIIASLACLTSIYLANQMRLSREVRSSQIRTMMYSLIGVIFSSILFVGAEAKSVCIRVAEYMSTSESANERKAGLDFLRQINPERDLMMECADARTAGIPGLFIRIEPTTQRQIYFAVTGKPYRDDKSANFSSMPDDYLQKHVVGAPVSGLFLVRSAMNGSVNPDSLSSTVNWTFVFKNRTYQPQEARAEIGLPEGAVISQMTLWPGGEPRNAHFNASGAAARAYNSSVVAGHDAPAIVTDLGRGRTLLHCYPVPAQGEMKIRLAVTVPLKLHTLTEASLSLPRFIDNNFAIQAENQLSMRSPEGLTTNLKDARTTTSPDGDRLLIGKMKEEDLSGSGLSIQVARKPSSAAIAIRDPFVRDLCYIIQSIKKVEAPPPSQLVVVVDGSQSVKAHSKEIQAALSKLPKNIQTSIILASDQSGDVPEPLPLQDGMKRLNSINLTGGQDNLQSVVKAAELAGQAKGGSVLWVHGPQPSFNNEIYIMAPYVSRPKFYELALDNGVMDANEFFKNHREIGPIMPIARSSNVQEDLNRFIAKWQPGGTDFQVDYAIRTDYKGPVANASQSAEIAALVANSEVQKMLHEGKLRTAAATAVSHHIVSSVSLASVLPGPFNRAANEINAGRNDINTHYSNQEVSSNIASQSSAASLPQEDSPVYQGTFPIWKSYQLQGATNGTIAPQGADATYITGVNTAGTVRINNLANLESLINMLANLGEILFIVYGGYVLLNSIFAIANGGIKTADEKVKDMPGAMSKLAFGALIIFFGISIPGMFNWFVASARDCNLFS